MNAFLLAAQFLTRLPVNVNITPTPELMGRSVLYYPAVGLLIGGLLWCLAQLLVNVEPMIVAALLLTVWVGLTGGLHLDGLADCTDGWIGGQADREKTFLIMKDPNAGPMAVIVLVLLLLLKFVALATLLKQELLFVLLIAPVMGRTVVPALMMTTPYLTPNGLGQTMVENLPQKPAYGLIAASLLVCLFLGGWVLSLAMVLFYGLLRMMLLRLFGGSTGDVYGAAVELSELFVLLVVACRIS
jgi:adenosylcobinamide-GDP ribazoletransferase